MVSLKSESRLEKVRAGQSRLLTCIRGSIVFALVVFFGLALYSQSSQSDGVQEKHSIVHNAKHQTERERVIQSPGAAAFVEENCELGSEEWWPEESWKRRTPGFLIIGAKKCGTTSLFHFMSRHPLIVKPRLKELLMFIPARFNFWEEPKNYDSKVLVEPARQWMYENDYPADDIRASNDTLSVEATPDYVLYSTYSTKALLCTVPWIKVVITLRNPTERLFSHFNFLKDPRLGNQNIRLSFEEWVKKDIADLQGKGVIPSGNMTTEDFFGSKQERDAWREYQKHPAGERYVSRSLYAFQIEEWFEALRLIGRDPAECVLIVREEDMKRDGQALSNRIFKWLGLEPHDVHAGTKAMATTYSSELTKETRKFLEEFMAPYNQRLYKLLGKEWEGIWDWSEKDYLDQPKAPSALPRPLAPDAEWGESNKSFVDRFCELGDTKSWWPEGDDSWQLRAPHFLVIGAKKAGTSSIWRFLLEHPDIVPAKTKELHTFQPAHIKQFQNVSQVGKKIRVDMLRDQMYNFDYKPAVKRLKANPNQVSFEATPDYLLYSTYSAQAILCTTPWAKILVSLRNPIDRLFSHYNFIMDDEKMPKWYIEKRQNITFEEWVEGDMAKLRKFGLIQEKYPSEQFFGSAFEKMAWRTYQRQRIDVGDRPVARSLYAFQIEEWFAWLIDAGRDPGSEMLVVQQEKMRTDANAVLGTMVDFLKLQPHDFKTEKDFMVTHYTFPEMNPDTRKKLQTFFDPYNKRLYKLLGKEWEGLWD